MVSQRHILLSGGGVMADNTKFVFVIGGDSKLKGDGGCGGVSAILPNPTNADRIRSMTDEELADEILRWFNWLNAVEWDDKRIIEWLKQEATE